MPDYQESNIEGTQFVRCRQVILNNPLGNEIKTVFFQEERVINAGLEKPILRDEGFVHNALRADNADTTFPIMDATGLVTGIGTYQQVYDMLASLYLHTALLRDQGISATSSGPAEQPA